MFIYVNVLVQQWRGALSDYLAACRLGSTLTWYNPLYKAQIVILTMGLSGLCELFISVYKVHCDIGFIPSR